MSQLIPFFIVNSFTTEPFAGNPAGVFLDCDDIDAETMRRLAGEVSLESAFVMQPVASDTLFRMRYFTHVLEIPYCGHATLAAVASLVQTGRVVAGADFAIETAAGKIGIQTNTTETGTLQIKMVQRPPAFGEPLDTAMVTEIATALGCPLQAILDTGLPVQSVSTGSPFLFVPLTNRSFVDAVPASFPAIADLSARTDTHGLYIFTVERTPGTSLSIWSRNFAPLAGLNEDPVTGSASGALGGYLWCTKQLPPDNQFTAFQGFGGGRGGTVSVFVDGDSDSVRAIHVTGTAIVLTSGTFSNATR